MRISGLNELRERLERLRPEEVMARALAEQAQRMAARVREGLSEQPGAAGHDEPWLRSGALRDSVGASPKREVFAAEANGLQAVVGSSDPAAVPQEMGTAHTPARPFLAPAAAAMGEEVARAVGAAMAAALRSDSPDANGTDADLSGGGPGGSDLPNRSSAGAGAPASASSANATGVDGPLPVANGVSPDRPTSTLLVGPGTPTDTDLLHLTADDGTPGNNQAQNKQFKDVIRIFGLKKSQARQLHDEITGENYSFIQILQMGQDMFDK